MTSNTKTAARFIATFGRVGDLRPAPGTWGSLAALPFAFILLLAFHPLVFIGAIIVVSLIGIWATNTLISDQEDHDPSYIVIDEVVGQWVALLPVAFGAFVMQVSLLTLWPAWLTAFVLFRVFDILKPGLIGTMDRRKDAVGVMLDDVVAGAFAAVGVMIFAALLHIVMWFS